MIGKKVKVFWPVDEQWYTGVVQEYNSSSGEHKLMYPDGDEEWVKIGENGTGGALSQTSPRHTDVYQRGRTQDRIGGDPYGGSPSKQPQLHQGMYGDMMGGIPHGQFNPYAPPFAGMGHPYGPPFGGPTGGPGGAFLHQYDMRTGMPYPPHQPRMSLSPQKEKRGDLSSGDSYNKSHPDSSEKTSSGSKKKSGPKTWSKEEDAKLLKMVEMMRMPIKWSLVAQNMPDRTGKQCRERYVNHLNPRLKSSDWSPAEDATIFHLYNSCGSQWAKMSKMIPGRTDNGIKNRFHNLRRQLEREDEHRVRLSKPEDFPDEVQLDRIREFPEHLKGKCNDLWDMTEGVGVLAAQSVLGGSFARNAGKFGPFKKADESGEQCARCGLFAPSTHCGTQICTKSKWCIACTRLPPHMCGNILRECLRLRRITEDSGDELDQKLVQANALNLALQGASNEREVKK